ncbi:MAG: hypothetical protein ABI451_05915 [Dokdonella sp.]
MNKKLSVVIAAIFATSASLAFAHDPQSEPMNNQPSAPEALAKGKADDAARLNQHVNTDRVSAVDERVLEVEKDLPTLTRTEVMLAPASLGSVTDEKWAKLHAYSNGTSVERIKVYPSTGNKTEEFYYDKGDLEMVFLEPNGASREGHDTHAEGTKYYFDANGLFAINVGGRMVQDIDLEAKAMGAKLQRESTALRNAAAGKATGDLPK